MELSNIKEVHQLRSYILELYNEQDGCRTCLHDIAVDRLEGGPDVSLEEIAVTCCKIWEVDKKQLFAKITTKDRTEGEQQRHRLCSFQWACLLFNNYTRESLTAFMGRKTYRLRECDTVGYNAIKWQKDEVALKYLSIFAELCLKSKGRIENAILDIRKRNIKGENEFWVRCIENQAFISKNWTNKLKSQNNYIANGLTIHSDGEMMYTLKDYPNYFFPMSSFKEL